MDYIIVVAGIAVVVALATWVERITRPDPTGVRREALRRVAELDAQRAADADVDAWLDYPQAGTRQEGGR